MDTNFPQPQSKYASQTVFLWKTSFSIKLSVVCTNILKVGFFSSLSSLHSSLRTVHQGLRSAPSALFFSPLPWSCLGLSPPLTVLCSWPHLLHTSWQGSHQCGYSTEAPHSGAVLLLQAVISLSHWSMIHVHESLGPLARCTAACCCYFSVAIAIIMTGLARSD